MRRNTPTISRQERTFGAGDIIVSKTDHLGRLTYANDIFLDVSRFRRSDVIGKPHSIVRHPDMPRGLFRQLWDTISAGKEIFAYIDNLASDGAHYWVLAHVTPTFDANGNITGYHSNRRLPERRPVEEIQNLYGRMRAEESRHSNAREAAEASARMMNEELEESGLTYEQYVWQLISGRAAA